MWPEVTDPEKFVYEDVAIAAYLLVRVCHRSSVGWGQVALAISLGVGDCCQGHDSGVCTSVCHSWFHT